MLTVSILFALALPNGNVKGLDLPDWFGFIFSPLAVVLFWYAVRKKAKKDDKNVDKHDE